MKNGFGLEVWNDNSTLSGIYNNNIVSGYTCINILNQRIFKGNNIIILRNFSKW